MAHVRRRSRHWRLTRTLLLLVVLAAAAGALTVHFVRQPTAAPPAGTSTHRQHHRPPDHAHQVRSPTIPGLPAWTLIASSSANVAGYGNLATKTPAVTVPASWTGLSLAYPVLARTGLYVQVALAPGASSTPSAWIPVTAVALERTPYRVVVDLAHTRVLLLDAGRVTMCAPADVGAATTPTPTGDFFVVALVDPPSSLYGPFVVLTSATVGRVTDWTQGGTPLITFSGPIGLPVIGAYATAGGIHLPTADLQQLDVLPAGTPVDVMSTVPDSAALRHLCSAASTSTSTTLTGASG